LAHSAFLIFWSLKLWFVVGIACKHDIVAIALAINENHTLPVNMPTPTGDTNPHFLVLVGTNLLSILQSLL
jgi:hypothetical protein